MPFGNFDDKLTLSAGVVKASGPRDDNEHVLELCAWVFQREAGSDAVVTEMTTMGRHVHEPQGKWELPLSAVGSNPNGLKPGQAFAAAVALFRDADGKEKVLQWTEPVELIS